MHNVYSLKGSEFKNPFFYILKSEQNTCLKLRIIRYVLVSTLEKKIHSFHTVLSVPIFNDWFSVVVFRLGPSQGNTLFSITKNTVIIPVSFAGAN